MQSLVLSTDAAGAAILDAYLARIGIVSTHAHVARDGSTTSTRGDSGANFLIATDPRGQARVHIGGRHLRVGLDLVKSSGISYLIEDTKPEQPAQLKKAGTSPAPAGERLKIRMSAFDASVFAQWLTSHGLSELEARQEGAEAIFRAGDSGVQFAIRVSLADPSAPARIVLSGRQARAGLTFLKQFAAETGTSWSMTPLSPKPAAQAQPKATSTKAKPAQAQPKKPATQARPAAQAQPTSAARQAALRAQRAGEATRAQKSANQRAAQQSQRWLEEELAGADRRVHSQLRKSFAEHLQAGDFADDPRVRDGAANWLWRMEKSRRAGDHAAAALYRAKLDMTIANAVADLYK